MMYNLKSEAYKQRQYKKRLEMRKKFCFCPFCGGHVEDQAFYQKAAMFTCDDCGSIFQPTKKALEICFAEAEETKKIEPEVNFVLKAKEEKSVIFG